MDLTSYARILQRRWLILAAFCLLGLALGGASWVLTDSQQSFYRATHTLVVAGSGVNLERAAVIATTGDVPERVSGRLPGNTAAQLAAQVKAVARPDVGFLEITAVGTDPGRTAEIADAFAEETALYVERLEDAGRDARIRKLQDRADELATDIADLEEQLSLTFDPELADELRVRIAARRDQASAIGSELDSLRNEALTTTVLQTFATAEAVPISGPQFRELFNSGGAAEGPDPATAIAGARPLGLPPRLGLGGVLGLLAGVAAALALERLDPRLRTKAATEAVFGWPVIAEVPPLSRDQQRDRVVLSATAPRSRTAEAYRVVRSSVLLAGAGTVPIEDDLVRPERSLTDGLVVLVTSAGPAEGKTTTVANLAVVLGEAGRRVLVVNCDFRRPTLGTYLGVDTHLAKVMPTDLPNVHLLAQVTDAPDVANPADVIATQHAVIAEARRRFDVVVLDTAPLLTTNDANDVLDAADLVVVVSRAGRTTRETADRCAEALERRRAPVLGVVLVAAADAPSGRYYYGDYYLDDRSRPEGGKPEHERAGRHHHRRHHDDDRWREPALVGSTAATVDTTTVDDPPSSGREPSTASGAAPPLDTPAPAKPDVKPDTTAGAAKSDTAADAKADAKPGATAGPTKPDARPDTKPDGKPDGKPDTKPGTITTGTAPAGDRAEKSAPVTSRAGSRRRGRR